MHTKVLINLTVDRCQHRDHDHAAADAGGATSGPASSPATAPVARKIDSDSMLSKAQLLIEAAI